MKLPIFTARPDQVEDDIHLCYQEAQKELMDQKIDLLLAILPDNNGSLYGNVYHRIHSFFTSVTYMSRLMLLLTTGNVKKICVTDIGVMSQCCRKSIVFTKYSNILANIAIKINVKVLNLGFSSSCIVSKT